MKTILSLILFSFALTGFSQISHDLEIYSANGKPFTLYMNNKQVNEIPKPSVVIKNTEHDIAKIKVVMEDASLEKKIWIAMPGETQTSAQAYSSVFEIKEKKGKYKMRVQSRSPKKIQSPNTTVIIQEQ